MLVDTCQVDEAMAAGVSLAVCSTSNEAAVRTLVRILMGEERYAAFSFFCGDAVPRKKPEPDVYRRRALSLDGSANATERFRVDYGLTTCQVPAGFRDTGHPTRQLCGH